ncbi:hypothetical protein HanPI659440_Chr15g0611221 [Helianthus annuus]|nr:hypothetical protein HanPI659440_Chr15g0611221 [Helianthus annuus]
MLETLVNNPVWLQHHGIIHVANVVLNSVEIDETVAALMVAARSVGHQEGYHECVAHVYEDLKVQWDDRFSTSHGKNVEGVFTAAQEAYDSLSLPVMDLVSDSLKHDDYVDWLNSIFELPKGQEVEENDMVGGEDISLSQFRLFVNYYYCLGY